jgi:hypothetical protein
VGQGGRISGEAVETNGGKMMKQRKGCWKDGGIPLKASELPQSFDADIYFMIGS